MGTSPASTVRVTAIEPVGESKVRIRFEMTVDVHRLAAVGSEMLHAAVKKTNADPRKKH